MDSLPTGIELTKFTVECHINEYAIGLPIVFDAGKDLRTTISLPASVEGTHYFCAVHAWYD